MFQWTGPGLEQAVQWTGQTAWQHWQYQTTPSDTPKFFAIMWLFGRHYDIKKLREWRISVTNRFLLTENFSVSRILIKNGKWKGVTRVINKFRSRDREILGATRVVGRIIYYCASNIINDTKNTINLCDKFDKFSYEISVV
jgi:hypothetical protein